MQIIELATAADLAKDVSNLGFSNLDFSTLDFLALASAHPARYPALLQSAALSAPEHTPIGRWDLLPVASGEQIFDQPEFLGALAQATNANLAHGRIPSGAGDADAPPFVGGWLVYLGYEMAAEVEPILRLPIPSYPFPRAHAWRTPVVLARDAVSGRCLVAIEAGFEALWAQVQADVAALATAPAHAYPDCSFSVQEDAPETFLHGVQKALEYIHAGDVFQVNLSRAWSARASTDITPAQVFARLRKANPAPFAALLQLADGAVISSSPERLVSVAGGVVQTRPIAGTRARTSDDALIKRELIADPKERAEHIMLIDLERNDLGRVCKPGTVIVDELLGIETYQHVHHIVSNVRGTLRADQSALDVLRAVFPGGTITGCPKVRCMQIIAELEGVGRGPYTGAVGYIGHDGRMDFNILIRTIAQVGRTLHFRAGAGIVADSVPERELAETRAKAKGMLGALQ
jgi:anthranilate synthase component I